MQLDLFAQPKIEPPKVRFYKDLSIHEKINVKLNCQLPHVHLLNARKGYCKTSPICRYDHPEGIKWKTFKWLMMHRHGGVIRLTKPEIRKRAAQIEEYKRLKLSY